MNGAPAKPISGVPPSSATVRATASEIGARASSRTAGSSAVSAATSFAVRVAVPRTGPVPATISTSTPTSLSGTTMSLKKIAASTPWRRTGWSVISLASSGSRQTSSMRVPTRSSRYSGRERPAWRMNHTGVTSGLVPW